MKPFTKDEKDYIYDRFFFQLSGKGVVPHVHPDMITIPNDPSRLSDCWEIIDIITELGLEPTE